MPAHEANLPRWTWLPLPRGQPAEPVARRWLSTQLEVPQDRLPLQRDEYGRPQLGGAFQHWDCNWSHSGEGLLIALGHRVRVGIDLEWPRPRPRVLELAHRFFTAAEAGWLTGLEDADRQHAFLRLWCAKEAVLKAHGHGLSFGLDKLELEVTPDGVHLTTCDPALGDPAHWSVNELVPAPGYVGSLAWRCSEPSAAHHSKRGLPGKHPQRP